jgi:hypothetical protein
MILFNRQPEAAKSALNSFSVRSLPPVNSIITKSITFDHVLHLLKDEVDRTLAQIGCPSVSELSIDYVMADGSMPTTARPSVRTFAKAS